MITPGWVMDIFAAIMLAVTVLSAARLVALRPWRSAAARANLADADLDIAHLLMAVAMAGMLTPSLRTLPNDAWDVIFALMTVWFGWRAWHSSRGQGVRALAAGHHVPHLVHSASMFYMLVAVAPPPANGGMGGMSGMKSIGGSFPAMTMSLRMPVVALIFALWLAAYAVMDLDQLSGPGGHGHDGHATAPAATASPVFASSAATGRTPDSRAPDSRAPGTVVITANGEPGESTDSDAAPDAGDPRPAAPQPSAPRADGQNARTLSGVLLTSHLAAGCRIAMGITMAFMLVIMI